jgi:F-type H+-transporting ATPase subunit gamma
MSLKSVKTKIKSIDKTRQVTKAMEAVAAVKMRKSQAQALGARAYAISALSILKGIASTHELQSSPLLSRRQTKKTLLIVISADRGLAGSYGSTLIKAISKFITKENLSRDNTEVIAVGKKAIEYFSKREYKLHLHFEKWSDKISFSEVSPLARLTSELYTSKQIDRAIIIYTNFISTLKQEVYIRELLPLSAENIQEVISGITPEKGMHAQNHDDKPEKLVPYLFEPDVEQLTEQLLPELFKIQFYHSVLEANASEHSARMIAMKNASDSARDISKALKLKFNKVRQAAITREVSEIVGGMESMKIID